MTQGDITLGKMTFRQLDLTFLTNLFGQFLAWAPMVSFVLAALGLISFFFFYLIFHFFCKKFLCNYVSIKLK